jgi:hypothetical protein
VDKVGLIENLEKFDEEPKTFNDFFELIKKILKEWIDFSDEMYYNIVSLWIMGTYMHDKFVSYPYLFINAMKQSGKTRLLNLISRLSNKGFLAVNLTESTLFRLPAIEKVTMCIDEAENIGSRDRENLRLLLNAGYKKGLFVPRSRRLPNEKWIVEKFVVFCPIVLSNISGLDDVLEDRCILIPLERSNNVEIISKMEDFDHDYNMNLYMRQLSTLVQLCSVVMPYTKTMAEYKSTQTTLTTLTTLNTLTTLTTQSTFNDKIEDLKKIGIAGRNLEIWFPLLFIAFQIEEALFDNLLPFILQIIKEKQELELTENRDVVFLSFLYNNFEETKDFITVREICDTYKRDEPEDQWFSSKWVGRALKRHRITIEKRRLTKGFEVRINFKKLTDLCKKLGIQKQEKPKISDEIKPVLKDRPDWQDYIEGKDTE